MKYDIGSKHKKNPDENPELPLDYKILVKNVETKV
jgi:hypothetical protein